MVKYFYYFSLGLLLWTCTPKVSQQVEKTSTESATTVAQSATKSAEAYTPKPERTTDRTPELPEKLVESPDIMSQPVPMDPRVRMGKLDNGLTYYIQANTKPENRAELRLAVAAGSINEDDDQLGLAHFVEHMAFNGTANFEKSELVDYLQSVGSKFGPDLNAYTSFDETVYMLQVRTDSQELFDKGMLILEDWSHAITFENEEIDKERGVVISELRSGLSASERMRNKYLPVIFHESKYADRLPIGTRDILSNAPYDALKRYYRDWYRPNLMAVVVVGDVDVDATEASIKERFSKLKNPENARERESYGFPKHEQTLVSIAKDVEASFTDARVMYKHDHKYVKNIGDYRRSLIQSLYNRMLNSRLDELRQSAEPPFLYGYSGYGRQVSTLDSYTSYCSTGEGGILSGLESVLRENRRVRLHGFNASEMERTKIEMISELETSAKEEDKFESRRICMQYVYNFLNKNPVPSPTQRLQLGKALLPTITVEQINEIANTWITDGDNRVIVITGPDKEGVPLPTEDEVLALVSKVEMEEVAPYEDAVTNVPLVSDELSGGSIISEKYNEKVDITEWTLSNGVHVILKPTEFQNDEILFTALSPGGHSIYPDEKYQSASVASMLVGQSGISEFNKIELEKMMAGKQVSVFPYISEREEGLQGSSTIKDRETMFQLIYLYFTASRKDEETYKSIMTRQRQILQNLRVNPNYYFNDRVTEVKYQGHKRRGIPTVEDLDEVSLDVAVDVFRDRFADASDFTFVFVGNFTPEDIKSDITKYLGALPSINREETWKDVEANVTPGTHVKRFNFGQAPKSQVQISWTDVFDFDDRDAKLQFFFLREIMRNVFRESMREDMGGVYGVSVSGNISKYPKEKYTFTISFNAEPDQVDSLIITARNDISKMIKEGPSEEDMTKVREVFIQERQKSLEKNNYWLNAMKNYIMHDYKLEGEMLDNYEKRVRAVTTDQVLKIAGQVFGTENNIEIVMMPGEAVGED